MSIALLPDGALSAIGRVVAGWSHVESVFDMIFTVVVIRHHEFEYDDPRLLRLAAPFKERIREVRTALREVHPTNLDDWERALSRTGNLRDKRDVVAHGIWNAIPIPDPNEIVIDQLRVHLSHKSYRNQRPHTFGPIRIDTIESRATQISELELELSLLLHTLDIRSEPQCPAVDRS